MRAGMYGWKVHRPVYGYSVVSVIGEWAVAKPA
jgi:hypothetical protein